MIDFDQLEREVRLGDIDEVLARPIVFPAEVALLATVLERPTSVQGVTAEPGRAWTLLWAALRVQTGAPHWSSGVLDRLVEAASDAGHWGGVSQLYGSLQDALREVSRVPSVSMTHFVRDLGRLCRSRGALLKAPPRPPPFTPIEALALLYAPGVERFPATVHKEMVAASKGQAFEEEMVLGLDFD